MDSDNGLAPMEWQAIIWANDGYFTNAWYASPGLSESISYLADLEDKKLYIFAKLLMEMVFWLQMVVQISVQNGCPDLNELISYFQYFLVFCGVGCILAYGGMVMN